MVKHTRFTGMRREIDIISVDGVDLMNRGTGLRGRRMTSTQHKAMQTLWVRVDFPRGMVIRGKVKGNRKETILSDKNAHSHPKAKFQRPSRGFQSDDSRGPSAIILQIAKPN